MKLEHMCNMLWEENMSKDYKLPNWVKVNVTNELYHYWENVKLLEELKDEIMESSSAPPDGQPRGNQRGKPTESKVMKLNSRAILVTANKIMQIENVIKMLNESEKEVFNLIFKERLNNIQVYERKKIGRYTYYNVKNKVIWLVSIEMGYLID